ncbi:hypothetical protein [Dactylosporangium sp. CA-233914]|uniref:hypothetical protein n=1 Tax=Dactylosporangium sp. CA-233914 TaxID=3239934 RepID=UPI003D8DAE24
MLPLRRFKPHKTRNGSSNDPTSVRRLAADHAFDCGDVVIGHEGAVGRAAALRATGRFRLALENDVVALWRGALAGQVTAACCDEMIAEFDRHGMRLSSARRSRRRRRAAGPTRTPSP